jgi:methylated-DNA-[protein]-cysteine S-methyltransferase
MERAALTERAAQTLRMATPLGELELVAQAGELVAVRMEPRARAGADGDGVEILTTAKRQLEDYFAGKSDSFALPTRRAGTEFQLAVWDALREVGYGKTITYGELAASIGRPNAGRAVGQALAHNPLPIIVPCHRVVGHLGDLTGFGGGLDRKRLLLELESRRTRHASSGASPRPAE